MSQTKEQEKQKQKKPAVPCWCCSSVEYWKRKDGEWICTQCHPPCDELEIKSENK